MFSFAFLFHHFMTRRTRCSIMTNRLAEMTAWKGDPTIFGTRWTLPRMAIMLLNVFMMALTGLLTYKRALRIQALSVLLTSHCHGSSSTLARDGHHHRTGRTRSLMTRQKTGMPSAIQALIADLPVKPSQRSYNCALQVMPVATPSTTFMQAATLQLLTFGGAEGFFTAFACELALATAARLLHLKITRRTWRNMTLEIACMATRKDLVAGLVTGRSGFSTGDIKHY